MTKKSYSLWLPYFKQGDDLSHALAESKGDEQKAFLAHAEALLAAVAVLKRCADLAAAGLLSIETADTHCIFVACDKDLGTRLVAEGLLIEEPCENEECDCAEGDMEDSDA